MKLLLCVSVLLGAAVARAAAPRERDMVYIPAGEFLMGTSKAEAKRLAKLYGVHPTLFLTEAPQREVKLKAFLIDRCPVTHAQYKKFMDASGHRPPFNWGGRSLPAGKADHPVTGLVWHAAAAYAEWAGLRLPTEAEWERAARGSEGRAYPWGNAWRDDATRIGDPASPQTRALTTPVGAFPAGASPYGVLDLCGNVAEWTATPSQPPNPERKWAWYVVKGAGAAHTQRYNFRCAARNFSAHTSRAQAWIGFRCARDAPEPVGTKPGITKAPKPEPAAPAPGPKTERFGKQPIRIEPRQGGAGAVIRVPWFPEGHFSLYVPEGDGAAGLPLAWAAKHQGVRWAGKPDGSCEYACTFAGKAVLRVTLVPRADAVDFTIALRNLTDKPLTAVHSNTCFNVQASPYFNDPERVRSFVWTDAGPTGLLEMPIQPNSGEPLHGGWSVAAPGKPAPKGGSTARHAFIATRSRDAQWVIAQAYAEGASVATNAHYSCLHTRPRWPDIPPGEERSVLGKLYFIKGGPDELLSRWQADFAR
ncbi:SUMF1/EgtB/PvdO family nonheme iron enzyme [bacterium]|nr:SUMF1/EgtB/PvdO family nonheme iron enzyme [bacterium]